MEVEYRIVPGYPNYRAGSDGSIWTFRCIDVKGIGRLHRWKKLNPSRGRYLKVDLCRNGMIFGTTVHVIVLLSFAGPCPAGYLARHFPDRNPHNNAISNLSWTTPKQNQQDRLFHGTDSRGEKHVSTNLTAAKVKTIRSLWATGEYYLKDIAKHYGVSLPCIAAIVYRTNWRHVL